MGQEGKFFQNQRPKKACRAQGGGGAGDGRTVAPGMGLSPCLHQEGVEACPLRSAGVGSLVLSVDMEVVGEKASWLPIQSWFPAVTGGFCVEESAEVSKIKRVEQKVKLPPAPVQILQVHTSSSLRHRKASLWTC